MGRLSRLLPSGSVVGEVPALAAELLGLRPGVLAVTGGHDQPAGALGCGAVAEGIAMDSTGTVECVGVASPRLVLDDALLAGNLPVSPHTAPGMTIVFGYSTTGGALLRWYRDTFGRAELDEARASGRDVYDLILQQASPGPSPVLILPHFVGSGTPWMDAASKGAILGLDLSTTRGQIIKAMLDSVSYEIKLSLDAMEAAGIAVAGDAGLRRRGALAAVAASQGRHLRQAGAGHGRGRSALPGRGHPGRRRHRRVRLGGRGAGPHGARHGKPTSPIRPWSSATRSAMRSSSRSIPRWRR